MEVTASEAAKRQPAREHIEESAEFCLPTQTRPAAAAFAIKKVSSPGGGARASFHVDRGHRNGAHTDET